MQQVKIEKGRPLPPVRQAMTLPLDQMEAGDSFIGPPGMSYNTLRHIVLKFKKKHGGVFATRSKPQPRCFCVEPAPKGERP